MGESAENLERRVPVAAWAAGGPRLRRGWLRLPQKTTLILLILLMAVVTAIGGIFYYSTQSMLKSSQSAQASSFAYGLSATLGDMADPGRASIEMEFEALAKTPNLEFAVLTDSEGTPLVKSIENAQIWEYYKKMHAASAGSSSRQLGVVQEMPHDGHLSYAVAVPVFEIRGDGEPSHLFGYLHAAFSADAMIAQLHFMQAFVLFTCMGTVLGAIPIASLIARHITIPIQRLAAAAHALADGDLSHRVNLVRGDELGELAEAFNRMANTVESQQADIRQINLGLEQKVQDRTAELEKLNQRMQAEVSEKEDFLRAVSHDLNAPLRNIAGMASMLMLKYQNTLEKDALQRLERIQKNVEHECELINELLELSRIKTRREKIERVDLHELATAVSEGFGADFESRGITFSLTGQLPVMRCEKMRMRQALQNLIDNGIKYMREDGPKEIRMGFEWRPESEGGGEEGVFNVSDTGMGIASEDLPQLFRVFRRAKNASVMKVPGKGVGLASVKSIIENYHGRLWVESAQGVGTTFYFAIPRSHFEITQEVAA